MKLRPYQNAASDAVYREWQEVNSTLLVFPTGLGKTVVFSDVIRRAFPRRAIVLAHREELVWQARNKISRVTGLRCDVEMADYRANSNDLFGRASVVVSTIQTQCSGGDGGGRMAKFDPSQFGVLIIDECFPAGTMVDGKPIETYRAGDLIKAFDHESGKVVTSKVSRLFKSQPSALCRVLLANGKEIICTPGHPFFVANQGKYVPAIALAKLDMVLSITQHLNHVQKQLHSLWQRVPIEMESAHMFTRMRKGSQGGRRQTCDVSPVYNLREGNRMLWKEGAGNGAKREGSLPWGMRSHLLCSREFGNDGQNQSRVCVCPDERAQSDEQSRNAGEGFNQASGYGMDAAGAPWQRQDNHHAGDYGVHSWLANGGANRNQHAEKLWIPDLLQSGHWEPRFENCNRTGWPKSQETIAQARGCEENEVLGIIGVEGVEILQQRSSSGQIPLCRDGFVYNLEVETHHNYFADGVLVHNCHHATSSSYRRVIDYYRSNPNLKVLGVTATPDRADEMALGQVFESVAADYEILDAINDGWLVPIEQQMVQVSGLDFSSVRTTAGDLNGSDLAAVMEAERVSHEIAGASIEIIGQKRALVFTSSVKHAEVTANIFNRHRPGMAAWVCGKTDKDERRKILSDFAAGKVQVVSNCGVLTEGFDDPGVEIVIMGRPTKSRSLYAQMVGRATRPLPGIVETPEDETARREAIARSGKPSCLVVDFVGNSGKHKLVTSADILGGNAEDEVLDRAIIKARKSGKPVRMDEAVKEAEEELHEERRREEEARKARLVAKAKFTTQAVNPFDVLAVQPVKARGWDEGKILSEKQRGLLSKQGIDPDSIPYSQAKQLIAEIFRRWDGKLCSYKQARWLKARGYSTDMPMTEASALMDRWAKNGWRRPQEVTA
jgi:superfamily II DNA or RNA helicase